MTGCPNCNQKVSPGDEFCENCGVLLPKNNSSLSRAVNKASNGKGPVRPAPGKAPSPSPGGEIKCPNCSFINLAVEDFCQNCGVDLKAVGNHIPASKLPTISSPPANGSGNLVKCPRCENLNNPEDKFCRKCGHNFIAGAAPGKGNSQLELKPSSRQRNLEIQVGSSIGADGRYTLTRVIGKGGMGAVFLAEDKQLKRQVVIKAVLQSSDPTDTAQAIKEREYLAAIKHPNIVSIYDFVTAGAEGYIVMEYVNGKTLHSLMEEQNSPLEPATAIRYILGILPAFVYLHKLGLVYCDFKPQNIMVEELKDGTKQIKLIDLGTVIHFEKNPEAVYGTEGFYAPEAIRSPSPGTDIYTICRTLAYLVSWMDLNAPQFGMPPAEHYKGFRDFPTLYRFLVKGTHPVPARRFQTAEAAAGQLEGVLKVVAGGQPGVPVSSQLFPANGNARTSTGPLGGKGLAQLDETDPAVELLKLGDLAFRHGQNSQALMYYSQAVGQNPLSPDAHLRLGELALEGGRFPEALAEITKVQRLDPNNWKIAWYTGRLLEVQGNLSAAREQYFELIQDLPGELPPLLSLARVEAKLGRGKEAVDLYSLVIRADPSNTEALFGASEAYLQQKDYDGAALTLLSVNELSNKFSEAQLQVCEIFLYQKPDPDPRSLNEVSTALRRLEQQGNDSPRFLLARADFYGKALELTKKGGLDPTFQMPYENSQPGSQGSPSRRKLGNLAENAYKEYLSRNPLDPRREKIVREKFRVAPWRLF